MMKTRNKQWPVVIIAMLTVSFVLSGCVMSKSKYEASVTSVLADLERELKPKDKDKQSQALESAKSSFENMSPPDDFFIGHSDLVELVDLLSQSVKESDSKKGKNNTPEPVNTEAFQLARAAQNNYAKVLRELPFLEYELSKSLGELIQQTQNSAIRRPPTPGIVPPGSQP